MMNTKEQIVEQLTKEQNDEIQRVRVYTKMREFVKTQEDQNKTSVDGWWQARAKKYFSQIGWSCRFVNNYVRIWGGDSGFTESQALNLFLGFDRTPVLTVETFADRNSCHDQAAQNRINSRKTLLEDSNWLNLAATKIDNYLAAKKELESVMGGTSYQNEAYYIIKNLAKLKDC